MPREVARFLCDRCGKQYVSLEGARDCESGHNDIFRCTVCGKKHKTKESADLCALVGLPSYKFGIGEMFPELDGAKIVSLRVVGHKSGHIPGYELDRPVEGSTRVTEAFIVRKIKRMRTCLLCYTEFDTLGEAIACKAQGEPRHRWRRGDYITGFGEVTRVACTRDEQGRHVSVYIVYSTELQQARQLTESEITKKR